MIAEVIFITNQKGYDYAPDSTFDVLTMLLREKNLIYPREC